MIATLQLPAETDRGGSIFQAEGITKIYRMGKVEVHALRGIDLARASKGKAEKRRSLLARPLAPITDRSLHRGLDKRKSKQAASGTDPDQPILSSPPLIERYPSWLKGSIPASSLSFRGLRFIFISPMKKNR